MINVSNYFIFHLLFTYYSKDPGVFYLGLLITQILQYSGGGRRRSWCLRNWVMTMAGISLISDTRRPCIITILRERYAGRLQCGWEFFSLLVSYFLFLLSLLSSAFIIFPTKENAELGGTDCMRWDETKSCWLDLLRSGARNTRGGGGGWKKEKKSEL